MARNKFVAGLILLLLSVAANAQPSRSTNGCALLDKLVRDSVYAAATESDVNRPRHRIARRGRPATARLVGARQMCGNTTEVASRAFTEALSGLNMQVSWRDPRIGHDGPVCWSADPSACRPSYNPSNSPMPGYRQLFVHDAWQGVRNAIASQMPFGTASGVSNFTAESLDAALSSHLNATVDGPIYSKYSRHSSFGGRRAAKR